MTLRIFCKFYSWINSLLRRKAQWGCMAILIRPRCKQRPQRLLLGLRCQFEVFPVATGSINASVVANLTVWSVWGGGSKCQTRSTVWISTSAVLHMHTGSCSVKRSVKSGEWRHKMAVRRVSSFLLDVFNLYHYWAFVSGFFPTEFSVTVRSLEIRIMSTLWFLQM
jgi:hypothetical protein